MKKKYILFFSVIAFILLLLYISTFINSNHNVDNELIIATTTSTVDSGLLDYLKPTFENNFNENIRWLYLGTGQALAAGERGDADILLVHDVDREKSFIDNGHGTVRLAIMYNKFVIVGPEDDPANIRDIEDPVIALKKIADYNKQEKILFFSRGDLSGTHAQELKIWDKTGINIKNQNWYIETGQGMSPTLRITSEKSGYTITDVATFLKIKTELKDRISLEILVNSDHIDVLNPYSIILINKEKHPHLNHELAEKFALFLISKEGQSKIGSYKIDDNQLFFPIFGKNNNSEISSDEKTTLEWINKLIENGLTPPLSLIKHNIPN